MLKSYITITLRHLFRNKVSSFISIAGLAVGFACVIWISLYVKAELDYDNFVQDAQRIYRINIDGKMGDSEFYAGYTPPPAGAALQSNFPEVEAYTRVYQPGNLLVSTRGGAQNRSFIEKRILGVDSNFLQLLTYPVKEGNAATCLMRPNSIVLTEAAAKKYFGNQSALGRLLKVDRTKNPLQVTAVLAGLPAGSSLQFDMLIPVGNYADVKYFNWSWVWLNMATYVKLNKAAAANPDAVKNLEAKFPAMLRVQAAPAFARIGQPYDEFLKKGGRWNLHLQALPDIHLGSTDIISVVTEQNDGKNLYILGAIAGFIIILACVNFVNLSTAQSARRAKEIGVRKVMGSGKNQLIQQFLTEAFFFSLLGVMAAVLLVAVLLPYFNQLSGKAFTWVMLFNSKLALLVTSLVVGITLLAGSYPAFYLASFKPVNVLKGFNLFKAGNGNLNIRNGLVVVQFTISTALIICTLVVYLQLQYMQNRNLGFDKENVIVVANTQKLGNDIQQFKQDVQALSQVKSASISSSMFTHGSFGDFYTPIATTPQEHIAKDITLGSYLVDHDFVSTLNLKLTKGRAFDKRFNDSLSVVLNEAAVKQIGWKNPIGRYIRYPGGKMELYKVVGVVKDFNFESLHDAIVPFAFFHESSKSFDTYTSVITIKLKPGNPVHTLEQMSRKWKIYNAEHPFEYTFLDADLNAQYTADRRMGSLLLTFTSVSIFVACLGLLGLVIYTAQRRTKEIGIRKVLGASVTQITLLLSTDFIRLVMLAILIASPLAWLAMKKWLQNFAYPVTLSWWVFALAGLASVFIAFVTLSIQSVKAAVANPAKSLKTE
jgi:putative ABC transport system permease protein